MSEECKKQQDAATLTGEAMRAAVEEAHGAFRGWLETTYPLNAVVEFTMYGDVQVGTVEGHYFGHYFGHPYIYIAVKTGYYRINPLKETVTVKVTTPQS
jgi:hypothetical protein